ncbi:hypothetical protein L1987_66281 [Smallanthus sonchifolius]|uniref:Uncharacterized protein n=1 Tax=Smallanthus sonchifolius TaxID=185202 RepID=A0ACB9BWQ4_9ASTR|nr:hypothetical protein L1987_66281 [Smallanthus sonchifolius]
MMQRFVLNSSRPIFIFAYPNQIPRKLTHKRSLQRVYREQLKATAPALQATTSFALSLPFHQLKSVCLILMKQGSHARYITEDDYVLIQTV